jgi:predicted phage terminase large subunit-like protein
MTHWHEDDLAGRLMERDEEEDDPDYKWTIVKLPAICEGNDPEDYPVKREIGDALCPELHPIKQLRNIEKTMGTMFAAGYQQRPAPEEGDIWKKSWFCVDQDPEKPIRRVHNFPERIKRTQMWDTSLETKERNDPNAMIEGCKGDDGFYYVAAMVNEKMEFPQLVTRMRTEMERVGNVEVCAEDKAAAKPARQTLKTLGIPLIEVPSGTLDKVVKARSVSHYAEGGGGLIRFVDLPGNCNDELLYQLLIFPNGKHDDLHDAFVLYLRRATGKSEGWDDDTLKDIVKSLSQ